MKSQMGKGTLFAVLSYVFWGLLPLYWKALSYLSSEVILAHRIIWALVFTTLMIIFFRSWKELRSVFKDRNKILRMIGAAVLICANWWLYIWAIGNGHVIESALGYYINPLVSVVLGIFFMKERLSKYQIIAFSLAVIAVLVMTVGSGQFPLISIGLALTFGFYGLMKKNAGLSSLVSLQLETLFSLPLAILLLIPTVAVTASPWGANHEGWIQIALLVCAGPVTAIPLWLFGAGAKRITMVRLGFAQYVSPTLQLILGILVFHETFNGIKAWAFILIWIALGIFMWSEIKAIQSRNKELPLA